MNTLSGDTLATGAGDVTFTIAGQADVNLIAVATKGESLVREIQLTRH
jgi:hypothetical protein